ncbi:MAG: hypothetical protein HQL56_04295 [Magnetococcales bacterium]|nr:hypothetical protein [Magnetococcales bacterium]
MSQEIPSPPSSNGRRPLLLQLLLPGLILAQAAIVMALSIQYDSIYNLDIFYHQFIRHELPGGFLAALLLLIGIFFGHRLAPNRVDHLLRFLGSHPAVAPITLVSLCLGSYFVYHNHPLAMDEIVPLFQAKIFAEGRLTGLFPPEMVDWLVIKGFNNYFLKASPITGEVVSIYWPGLALLLTPFVKLGLPWLLNPLLGTGTLLLIRHLANKLIPHPAAAGWAVLFTLASPVFGVYAISYYSMAAHLFLNLLYMALLLQGTRKHAFLAGLAGSLALVLHQPVPHLLFCLPWIVWLAWRRERWALLLALIGGYLPLSLVVGYGWYWLRGTIPMPPPPGPLRLPSTTEELSLADLLIRQPLAIVAHTFSLPNAISLRFRFMELLKLFTWALPGLPILALLAIRFIPKGSPLRLLTASALVTFALFFFIPFSQGHGWGNRYFHSVWAILPLLGALFLVEAEKRNPLWKPCLALLGLLSLLLGNGLRAYEVDQFLSEHLAQRPPVLSRDGERQITFLGLQGGYYMQDLLINDPFLRDPVIYLPNRGATANQALLARQFPNMVFAGRYGLSTVYLDRNAALFRETSAKP